MTSKNSENRKLGQITKAIFKWSLISLVSVVSLALITESYFKNQNVKNYPAPGQLYQVSEHKMHIWCEGSGDPVIVLDSGASMFSVGWRWVMPQLSPATRVCAFDRSGLGWSEASAPPYDGISAAHELNELLQQAGVRSPFIICRTFTGCQSGWDLSPAVSQRFECTHHAGTCKS